MLTNSVAIKLSSPLQLGSPFRDPVMKFALKFPTQTVDFFLCRLSDTSLSRIFHFFLRHKDGAPLKDALATGSQKLINATFVLPVSTCTAFQSKLDSLSLCGLHTVSQQPASVVCTVRRAWKWSFNTPLLPSSQYPLHSPPPSSLFLMTHLPRSVMSCITRQSRSAI